MGLTKLLNLQKTDRKAFEKELKKHPLLKNAFETHYKMGYEKGYRKGYEEGRKIAQKEGKRNVLEKIAVRCFREGIDLKVISRATRLSEDHLLKIFRDRGLM